MMGPLPAAGRGGLVALLFEVPLQEAQVLHVGAEGDVEGVADQWHGADDGVDQRIADHAPQRELRHAELARLPDEIPGHHLRRDVTHHRYEAEQGIGAEADARAGDGE